MPSLLPILVNKARKPKFELHLTIYDLNNVPLVSGTSQIKWSLPHSMHGEHRSRTSKCPIDGVNHRVSYNYSKVVPLRITIDKNNILTECPIEFEVAQEFPSGSGMREERIVLGTVKLNLSEYVEESENFPRRSISSAPGGTPGGGRARARSSLENAREKILGPALNGRPGSGHGSGPPSSPKSTMSQGAATTSSSEGPIVEEDVAEEGIVRRYLMQDSKINSTLKIGILMVQLDGDRNYVAPALKTAPMFGGIAGIMASGESTVDAARDDPSHGKTTTQNPSSSLKARDASELQDMYRRTLAASWACQPGELPADECVEDIFGGGDGWKNPASPYRSRETNSRSKSRIPDDASSSRSSGSEEVHHGTLRPSDLRKLRKYMHHRHHSGASEKSGLSTVIGSPPLTSTIEDDNNINNGNNNNLGHSGSTHSSRSHKGRSVSRHRPATGHSNHRRQHSRESGHNAPFSLDAAVNSGNGVLGPAVLIEETNSNSASHGRRESLTSLAPTLGSISTERDSHGNHHERGREGFRRPKEVDEFEVRSDLVSWALPGAVA
ncbi:hypothetical protein PG993_012162 [Apiospora rasikravindrae]|uniref:C2 NT-type domain-containing protein n=1 Tax=Apiospora rasikravindrae TaxID=990691 RepID=A0ABR1S3D6_9PEZI